MPTDMATAGNFTLTADGDIVIGRPGSKQSVGGPCKPRAKAGR